MSNVIFQSRTRIYTNFHSGEHKEQYVLDKVKNACESLASSLPKLLTESVFIEGALDGGDIINHEITPNRAISWPVHIKHLNKDNAKWCLKLFKNPKSYLKKVHALFDNEGTLSIDIDTRLAVSDTILEKIVNSTRNDKDFNEQMCFLHTIYNAVSASKYLFISRLCSAIRVCPGLDTEDICDLYLTEIHADPMSKEFERYVYQLDEEPTSLYKKLWEMQIDKII